MRTQQIEIPTFFPTGMRWAYNDEGDWELQADPHYNKPVFQIMRPNGKWIVGYYSIEEAEMFLPEYEWQYPNEILYIKETIEA